MKIADKSSWSPQCATNVRDERRFRVDRDQELTENFIKFSFASFVNGSLVEQLGLLGGVLPCQYQIHATSLPLVRNRPTLSTYSEQT